MLIKEQQQHTNLRWANERIFNLDEGGTKNYDCANTAQTL